MPELWYFCAITKLYTGFLVFPANEALCVIKYKPRSFSKKEDATSAPDTRVPAVRYVVNTSLYGCQTVLQHLGLELALHGKKNDYWY